MTDRDSTGCLRLRFVAMGQMPSDGAEYVVLDRADYVRWVDAKETEFKALLDELSKVTAERKKHHDEADELRRVNTRLAGAVDDACSERDAALDRIAAIDAELTAALEKVEAQAESAAKSTIPHRGPTVEVKPQPTPTWRSWEPIASAPRDGSPVWCRWKPYGLELGAWQCGWAYWDGNGWAASTSQIRLVYATDWLRSPVW